MTRGARGGPGTSQKSSDFGYFGLWRGPRPWYWYILVLLLCSFMSLLMFSFVLVCFVLLVFFVGKKAGPSMALLGVGNMLQKKFKKICFKNNLSKWAPSKQPSYIIPSMFTNNLIHVGPLQCPLNPIFPRGIFAISHAFAFRSQTTQLKCVPSGPKP